MKAIIRGNVDDNDDGLPAWLPPHIKDALVKAGVENANDLQYLSNDDMEAWNQCGIELGAVTRRKLEQYRLEATCFSGNMGLDAKKRKFAKVKIQQMGKIAGVTDISKLAKAASIAQGADNV